ncbi:unnamed protein product [Spirodela intermedia]|uniref:Uncharacterized protein n=1 Tax=Spirodela intermedia TaxID=51605 RepID=A0A7I8JJU8_SPIIN|nr:unnamed protein product [Spirodela intermedia]CAA6669863.1 unnamed protein product [Spirodela intermedia]
MQAKIDSFFKRPVARIPKPTASIPGNVGPDAGNSIGWGRRMSKRCRSDEEKDEDDQVLEAVDEASTTSAEGSNVGKVLKKRRSYAQCFLELGQPDFLLHTCSTCGMRYTRGDEDDEKLHRSFHNNYCRGIPFKGWRGERVISLDRATGDRIILILNDDPPGHKHKVLQMVDLLEQDLGLSSGWLLHNLCKVYMFISGNRIVGCVFSEPIKTAHRIVSVSIPSSITDNKDATRSTRSGKNMLRFGNMRLKKDDSGGAAIFCEEASVAAVCGIRAIWVAPSKRRQRIASKLLDSVRENFEAGSVVEPSRCAFSQPTAAGKAFASAYSRTASFLVYKPS